MDTAIYHGTYNRVQQLLKTIPLDKQQSAVVKQALQLAYLTGLGAGLEAANAKGVSNEH